VFSPFYVYRFSPGAIAQPASPADPVSYDGAGIAAALDRLLGEDRAAFNEIVDGLKEQFSHLKDIRIRTIQNYKKEPLKLLEFEQLDGRRIPAGFESDGVLLSLAYSWLRFQEGSPAIGVEEPETAAYPSLIKERVTLLKALAYPLGNEPPVQVIATTHSPFFLTALGDPDSIRVCDREFNIIKCPAGESIGDTIYTRLSWSVEG
jgi:predicted ATPase